MRILMILVVGILAVGCTSLRDRVVGEYEYKREDGGTIKSVFLDNGIVEYYENGKKLIEQKWSIVDGKIHTETDYGLINILRINPDKSITSIAYIEDGKRKDYGTANEQDQWTYKKIK